MFIDREDDSRICPIKVLAGLENVFCDKEKCEWWVSTPFVSCCAITLIGGALGELSKWRIRLYRD